MPRQGPTHEQIIEGKSAEVLGQFKKLLCCHWDDDQEPFLARVLEFLATDLEKFPFGGE